MKVLGTVTRRVDEKNILVKVVRSSACGGDCHTCGMCRGGEADILAECSDFVQEGDAVLITIPNKRYFSISFAVFSVPLIVILLAFWFCHRYLSEASSALISFAAGVLFFVGISLWFRRLEKPKATKKEE